MLKISLLPASYRKHIEGKKKKDLISRVALVLLVCTLIIYGGVLAKGLILDSKLDDIKAENLKIEEQFPALQKYQEIFNSLKKSQEVIKSITPQSPEAVEFLNLIFNQSPDYIQVLDVNLENWFTAGMCTLNCIAQDYSDVQDYVDLFKTEEMAKYVKLVEVVSIKRSTSSEGQKSVEFTLALSMSNAIKVETQAPQIVTVTDKKGEAVTNADGKAETSVVPNTTAAGGTTVAGATTAAGATTVSGGATTAAANGSTTAKGDKK